VTRKTDNNGKICECDFSKKGIPLFIRSILPEDFEKVKIRG
jgi:hypothetical protein